MNDDDIIFSHPLHAESQLERKKERKKKQLDEALEK